MRKKPQKEQVVIKSVVDQKVSRKLGNTDSAQELEKIEKGELFGLRLEEFIKTQTHHKVTQIRGAPGFNLDSYDIIDKVQNEKFAKQ